MFEMTAVSFLLQLLVTHENKEKEVEPDLEGKHFLNCTDNSILLILSAQIQKLIFS